MRDRLVFGLVAVVVAVCAISGAGWLLDNQRRDEAVERLLVGIAAAPNGSVIDLAMAFDMEWDRAVLVGPYWSGSAANDALGFERYPDDEVITQGDGVYLLVFARDRGVVAEVPLYGQAFYFDELVKTFPAGNARFQVRRDAGGVLLRPV